MSFMFVFGFVSVSAIFVCFENALLVNGFKGRVDTCLAVFFCEEISWFLREFGFFSSQSDLKLRIC